MQRRENVLGGRYELGRLLGDGAFGVVHQAVSIANERGPGLGTVAIKKMKRKFYDWRECMQLREVQSLKRLNKAPGCPNVVGLKEVIRENDHLYFIFEYAEGNLFKLMEARRESGKSFPERSIQCVMMQVFTGLHYIHRNGFFHRDLKPENLLVNNGEALFSQPGELATKQAVIKLADFGLAREIRSRPPYTDYVSTRWYRAPEVLLGSQTYNSPIDLWAAGVIMAEMYLMRALFPGSSTNDELFKIAGVLGTPTPTNWPDAQTLAKSAGYVWPQIAKTSLHELMHQTGGASGAAASDAALQLLDQLLVWNPARRLSAQEGLNSRFVTQQG